MKNILIIGDSWGVPNYAGPNWGDEPYEHLEYQLRNLGYIVHNCSINGSPNSSSIDLAKAYLNGNEVNLEPISIVNNYVEAGQLTRINQVNLKIDWVVWFHTEFFRESYCEYNQKIDDHVIFLANKVYQYAANFFKTLDARLAIIGGQSPVKTDILKKYIDPDFLIEDWRSELVGKKLPELYTLTKVEWIENSSDSLEYKIELLKKHKEVIDAMQGHRYFPDGCHPGKLAHQMLATRLHQIFQNT